MVGRPLLEGLPLLDDRSPREEVLCSDDAMEALFPDRPLLDGLSVADDLLDFSKLDDRLLRVVEQLCSDNAFNVPLSLLDDLFWVFSRLDDRLLP